MGNQQGSLLYGVGVSPRSHRVLFTIPPSPFLLPLLKTSRRPFQTSSLNLILLHLLSPGPLFLPPPQSVDPTPDCASFPDAPSVRRRFFCRNVLPRLNSQPQPFPSSTDNRLNFVGSDFIILGTHPVLCSRPTRTAAAGTTVASGFRVAIWPFSAIIRIRLLPLCPPTTSALVTFGNPMPRN